MFRSQTFSCHTLWPIRDRTKLPSLMMRMTHHLRTPTQAAYDRLGKYKTVATETKGPEYDVTSEPLDHELVMISGEGRKHGAEAIGHGMFPRSSRRTLPEIKARQTSSSSSIKKTLDASNG